jgi:hypothetical protein
MPTDQQVQAGREVPHLRHDTIERFARTTASSSAKQPDRALRFLARVDSHLPTLADYAARRAFLDRQLEGWQWRYARFIATEGESEPIVIPADPPQAADFLLTITGLMARRSALEQQATAHA